MIKISRKTIYEDKLVELETPKPGSWIHVVNPDKIEREKLLSIAKVPLDFIKDAVDINERPRIERTNDGIYIIIRVPYRDEQRGLITIPLGIIIGAETIITILSRDLDLFNDFPGGKVQNFYTSKKTRFLFQVFSKVTHLYMSHMTGIQKQIEASESRFSNLSNKEIIDVAELEKSLIYFSSAVSENGNVLERLLQGKVLRLYKEDEDILSDIIIDNKQTIEMTAISSQILRSMREAYSSILSNNLNKVLKFLTSVTIILMIPTIISSYYGMNVELPFQNTAHIFILLVIFTAVILLILSFLFYKKDWM